MACSARIIVLICVYIHVRKKTPEYVSRDFTVFGQITSIYRHAKTVYGKIRDRVQAIFAQCLVTGHCYGPSNIESM